MKESPFNNDIVTGATTKRFLAKTIVYSGVVMTMIEFLTRLKEEGWTVKEVRELPKSWGRTRLHVTHNGLPVHYQADISPITVYKAVKPNSMAELPITKTEYTVFLSL